MPSSPLAYVIYLCPSSAKDCKSSANFTYAIGTYELRWSLSFCRIEKSLDAECFMRLPSELGGRKGLERLNLQIVPFFGSLDEKDVETANTSFYLLNSRSFDGDFHVHSTGHSYLCPLPKCHSVYNIGCLTNVEVQHHSTDAFTLQWDPPRISKEDVRGYVTTAITPSNCKDSKFLSSVILFKYDGTMYRSIDLQDILTAKQCGQNISRSFPADGKLMNADFRGLWQNTPYIVNIIPVGKLGDLGATWTLKLQTKEAVPCKPLHVELVLKDSHITLKWKEQTGPACGKTKRLLIDFQTDSNKPLRKEMSLADDSDDPNDGNYNEVQLVPSEYCHRYAAGLILQNNAGSSFYANASSALSIGYPALTKVDLANVSVFPLEISNDGGRMLSCPVSQHDSSPSFFQAVDVRASPKLSMCLEVGWDFLTPRTGVFGFLLVLKSSEASSEAEDAKENSTLSTNIHCRTIWIPCSDCVGEYTWKNSKDVVLEDMLKVFENCASKSGPKTAAISMMEELQQYMELSSTLDGTLNAVHKRVVLQLFLAEEDKPPSKSGSVQLYALKALQMQLAMQQAWGKTEKDDFNRVKLHSACTLDALHGECTSDVDSKLLQSQSDYVNASLIPGVCPISCVRVAEAKNLPQAYIAAQAPVQKTAILFWQMIWDNDVKLIIMLTRSFENSKEKCYPYWPVAKQSESEGDISEKTIGHFCIRLQSQENEISYTRRILVIINQDDNKIAPRRIVQLHMTAWTDFSAPRKDDLYAFLSEYWETRKKLEDNGSPILVHCSAGVGRTGTFIALDQLCQHVRVLHELGQTNGKSDLEDIYENLRGSQDRNAVKLNKMFANPAETIKIYETVLWLRSQRRFMVQNESQYIFLFDFIADYIARLSGEGMLRPFLYVINYIFIENAYDNI
ncbi:unnamed protein product [Schistocephalus solidus]|uniref:Protein-tyrosine-phosphatase n=1 Tax=Schistocephalus solidus TaxID=70667 RepID=A0A183SMP3_SCHSO|nr:unnamed protein product [Schistocephalus solidus]